MINFANIRRGWALLDPAEKRQARKVYWVVIVGAIAAAAMVISILPFFSALTNPGYIHSQPQLSWLYGRLGFDSDFDFLVLLGLGSICIIVLGNLLQLLRVYTVFTFSRMQMHNISHRLLGRYMRQPYEFFLNQNSNKISTHVLAESMQVVNNFYFPLIDLSASLVTSFAIISLLIWLNPIIALVSFGLIGGIYGIILFVLQHRLISLGEQQLSSNAARFRAANEALVGIKDIKILGREATYLKWYETPSKSFCRAQAQVSILSSVPQFAIQIVAFGGIILLCLILLQPESITEGSRLGTIIPTLSVFAFAGQKLLPEFQRLYGGFVLLRSSVPVVTALEREFSNTAHAGSFGDPDAPSMGLKQSLILDGISYRYPGADEDGLSNISFEIEMGMSVGIVGQSGAGKTTLVDIVLGLLRPTEGQLVVDGTPITPGNLSAWRRTLGYVPQSIFLSDTSIAKNIALGVPTAQLDEVRMRSAAAAAQLDEFITNTLPDGYQTSIGERGIKLSGGQRQRIGIARALYHNAQVMVFDEATSALDTATEQNLMTAITELARTKTIIVIAHRLSTVRNCDRIAILDRGQLVGFGPWEELEQENTYFRKIAMAGEEA